MSGPDRAARQRVVLACLALILLSLVLHGRIVWFGFVHFDDTTIITPHPELYNPHSLRASLYEIFYHSFPREEPLLLRDVSWALEARLFGFADSFAHHFGNLLLNALCCAALFAFLQRATRRPRFAFGVALAFALLPVHVEPVSWLMGRKDLLAGLFVLGALLAQQSEFAAAPGPQRRSAFLLSLAFTLFALLSKMGAVTCFGVLLLHRLLHPYLDGSRAPDAPLPAGSVRRAALYTAPHALLCVAIFLWFREIIQEFGVIAGRGPGPLDPAHLLRVLKLVPLIAACYLQMIFVPLRLSSFYTWPEVELPLGPADLAIVGLGGPALALATLYCCLRRRDLAFYALSFWVLLVPYLNIVYVGIWRADRYIYLSSFCVLTLAATLARDALEWAERRLRSSRAIRGGEPWLRQLAIGGAALWMVALAAQTLRLEPHWRDHTTLWSYEASLPAASAIGVESDAALKLDHARAASGMERESWIRAARMQIDRGLAHEQTLGRRDLGYAAPEEFYMSRLHSLRATIAQLEGAPPEEVVKHWRIAYDLFPKADRAYRLALAEAKLAGRAPMAEQEQLMRQSLEHFEAYVRLLYYNRDLQRNALRQLAELYGKRFPSVLTEGERLEREP